jgi:hypothetical protein
VWRESLPLRDTKMFIRFMAASMRGSRQVIQLSQNKIHGLKMG